MAKETSLSSSAAKTKSEIDKLLQKVRAVMESSSNQLDKSGEHIAHTTLEVAEKADDYVRENPWHGVGIGTAIGIFIGILISRH